MALTRGLLATSFASLSLVACAAILGFDGPVLRDDDGGTSDACAGDACAAAGRWSPVAAAPLGMLGRSAHSAVWTGKEMIVWGGETAAGPASDGAAYDPARDAWRALPASPLARRSGHAAVWSGREMIVWGGTSFIESRYYADGASYDPASGAWTKLPLPPTSFRGRREAVFAWSTTTRELVVWSGATDQLEPEEDGAAYSPDTKTWRTIAPAPVDGRTGAAPVWNGTKLVFFGGSQCKSSVGAFCVDGASYDPATDRWAVLPPAPRGVFNGPEGHAGVATGRGGSTATFWGGLQNGLEPAPLSSKGASFDEATQSWTVLQEPGPAVLARAPRAGMAAFGIGSRLFIWGGADVASVLDDGAGYDFESKIWAPMTKGGPAGRRDATVVWSGTSAILWGGSSAALGVYLDDGAIFTP